MGVNGNIKPEHQAQPGKVLCIWGDSGWGALVRQGKSHDGRFADQLVEASAAMVRSWAPQPAPAWVTCIPSHRHPHLVPDLARRLAGALNLSFLPVLEKTDVRAAQKEMANSSQQARNVDGSLRILGRVPTGPVLLVDDMVDSKWTLTIGAYLLTSNGSGQSVDRWNSRAIWVISRADSKYPKRLKARLKEDAPPLLYGCGDIGLLDRGGFAVVGSRHVDEDLISFAENVGRMTAEARRLIISGGAKGIDRAAMQGALLAGGDSAGVVADSLERAALARDNREPFSVEAAGRGRIPRMAMNSEWRWMVQRLLVWRSPSR